MTTYTPRFQFPVPDFNVAPWHTIMATTLNMIDSAIYNALASQLVWGVSTAYAVGQVVVDPSTGLLWTALVGHTSGTGTFAADRAANPTYWQLTLQTTAINGEAPVDVASAATVNLGGVTPTRVNITGTVTITSFGNSANLYKFVRFTEVLTLTHNSVSLILPGAANILTSAEDWGIFASDAAGNWHCVSYQHNTSVYAAPFDALAYNGMQVNGDMIISQANVDTAVTGITGVANKVIDGWAVSNLGASVVTVQRIASGLPGIIYALRMTITTVDAAIAATDCLFFLAYIEGTRTARLGLGAAGAQSSSYGMWVRSSVTGTYGLSPRNSAGDRSYVTTFTINAANTWEFKTFTIPGDITGTWLATSGAGLIFVITLMAGANFQTTAGSWQAGNFTTTAAQTNFAANNGATFDVTGFIALPGTGVPSSDRLPFIFRPLSEELRLAQRYYYKAGNGTTDILLRGGVFATGAGILHYTLPVTVRASPTLTATGDVNDGASFTTWDVKQTVDNRTIVFSKNGLTAATDFLDLSQIIADARL